MTSISLWGWYAFISQEIHHIFYPLLLCDCVSIYVLALVYY